MEQSLKQNKMGTMPVPRLILSLGVPMMLSMVGQALYNMVDTFFVSRIADTPQVAHMGDKAINALTLAYPVQMLIIALMVGIGIATNTMLARSLGKKDRERASIVAGNAMTIGLGCFIVIFLFGLFAAKAFIGSQTQDPLVAEMGTTYLRIVTVFSFGAIGYMCLEKVAMGCGNTKATMIGQLAGAVTNIILDPILIFGMLGLPAMGVTGAAIATVAGQFVSLFIIAYVVFFRTKELDRGLRFLRPRKDVMGQFLHISLPAITQQILAPIMSYGMNLILGAISATAITAYGVYYKLQYFIMMAAYGLNNASISSTAYNLGAKQKSRIYQILRFTLLLITAVMLVGVIVLQIFTRPIVGIFSISEEATQLCVLAVHIISLGFFFNAANTILQGICQALGSGLSSLTVTLLRFLVVPLPLACIFALTSIADKLVWAAIPIAEAAGFVVAVLLTRRLYIKKVAVLPDQI